jgi:phenylpyruvate tautomerase PptA (4-oxalocrotonate tautomerase family)
MPLMYVNYPNGAFSSEARDALAKELTDVALDCEGLEPTTFQVSTVWVYFNELPATHVYHGGKPGGTKVIALEVNCIEGGHTVETKKLLFERFTEVIGRHAGIAAGERVPVYVIVRDVPPPNWGMFGTTITLEQLKTPDYESTPV